MIITILTHDARWKGLAPTVKRAAEAVLFSINSPLEGESKSFLEDFGGGNIAQKNPPTKTSKAVLATPQGGSWGPASAPGSYKKPSLTILLSTNAEIKTLNKTYRGKNKPTNVLSFPDGSKVDGVLQLGDIILAYETIAREAKDQKKLLKSHLTHLTIHGVLHLLGFDHESESDAKVMESHEIALLACMGIANPYEAD